MKNLITVKSYTFDNVKKGDETVGRANVRLLNSKSVNPRYVAIIEKSENVDSVLYYVRMCKQSLPGHHDFYTDYEGMKSLTK